MPLALLILLSGAGCTRGGGAPDAGASRQGKAWQFGKLTVRVLPEVPNASQDLQVFVSGGGQPRYRWEKNGAPIPGEVGARLARSSFARGDVIDVVVQDGREEGRVSLRIGNALPEVTSVTLSPENICSGKDITATATATDSDGDPVTFSYRWFVNGSEISGDSAVLPGGRFKAGDRVCLRVTPHDGYGTGREYATQEAQIPNALPYFLSMPPTRFSGTVYSYQARAASPDGSAITYTLLAAPPGMTIDSNSGQITWPVTAESKECTIEIEARDGAGRASSQKFALAIGSSGGGRE